MIWLAASAALVGLVHSLSPSHWLPVVLVTKARKWPTRTAILGALVAASGHILVSIALGFVAIEIGAQLLASQEEAIEKYAGLGLALFGVAYGTWAYVRHLQCRGHEHHGPDPKRDRKGPFLFLFTLGFAPCIAVLPVFATAATAGAAAVALTMAAFAGGVLTALVGATLLVTFGVMKLDHPVFEHYGDVITGAAVACLGLGIFILS
jgi:ABC-type nickel/cobalt efflux system permease component RcnA